MYFRVWYCACVCEIKTTGWMTSTSPSGLISTLVPLPCVQRGWPVWNDKEALANWALAMGRPRRRQKGALIMSLAICLLVLPLQWGLLGPHALLRVSVHLSQSSLHGVLCLQYPCPTTPSPPPFQLPTLASSLVQGTALNLVLFFHLAHAFVDRPFIELLKYPNLIVSALSCWDCLQ